jgi:hypothetical protein
MSNWNPIIDTMLLFAWLQIQTISILLVSMHILRVPIIFLASSHLAAKSTLSNHVVHLRDLANLVKILVSLFRVVWISTRCFCCWLFMWGRFWSFYICSLYLHYAQSLRKLKHRCAFYLWLYDFPILDLSIK